MKGKVIITFLLNRLQMILFEMWVTQYFIRLNDIIGSFSGVNLTPYSGVVFLAPKRGIKNSFSGIKNHPRQWGVKITPKKELSCT